MSPYLAPEGGGSGGKMGPRGLLSLWLMVTLLSSIPNWMHSVASYPAPSTPSFDVSIRNSLRSPDPHHLPLALGLLLEIHSLPSLSLDVVTFSTLLSSLLRGNLVLSTNLIHLSLSLRDYSGVLLLFSGLRWRGLAPDLIGDLEQKALMGSKEIKQSLFRNACYRGEMLVKRISELGVD